LEIKLTYSRKTKHNLFTRFWAKEGLEAWYVYTKNGIVTRTTLRTYSKDGEHFTEKDIDVNSLPAAIDNYIKASYFEPTYNSSK